MRMQEEAGEPSWRAEAVEPGNALGLDGPRPRSSSSGGGLRPEASVPGERRLRPEHRRSSAARQRDADALLSPVDLMVDPLSSSRIPYHPGRTQPEDSGSNARQANRHGRSTTSRPIYYENNDNEESTC